MALLRKLWEFWKAFGNVLGQIQTTILLSLIYHLGVGPLAVLGKLGRRDLLQLHDDRTDSFSTALPPITNTIERAEKQF